MRYRKVVCGVFKKRPNRFIADVYIGNSLETVHVKNTGRCKELLIENSKVFLDRSDNENRKTKYDLISVYKGEKLINIDSQVPNKIFREWVEKGNLFEEIEYIKPESKYGNSRFDFYIETRKDKAYVEVKGVTLEEDGVVKFPDAPTERGVKHVKELIDAAKSGYKAYIVFIIQLEGAKYFVPNTQMHREFTEILNEAKEQGVEIIAIDCKVTKDSIEANKTVEVKLDHGI